MSNKYLTKYAFVWYNKNIKGRTFKEKHMNKQEAYNTSLLLREEIQKIRQITLDLNQQLSLIASTNGISSPEYFSKLAIWGHYMEMIEKLEVIYDNLVKEIKNGRH